MKLQDPNPSYVEGQAPPNDHCAANAGCPQHKMNDHLQCDEDNNNTSSTACAKETKDKAVQQSQSKGKHQRSDDAVRDKAQDLADQRVLDTIVGSTYNA